MKRNLMLIMLAFIVFFNGCAPIKDTTGVWVNTEKAKGKQFHKFFIIVLSGNIKARAELESTLANAVKNRGNEAIRSIDAIPPNIIDPAPPNKDSVWVKIISSGCDAVFVSSILNKEESVRYNEGGDAYSIGNTYTWQGDFFGYYTHWTQTIYNPGYFDKNKTYFVQSNLYEVQTKDIMWSVQSKVFNPTSINSFSKSYTTTLTKKLEDSKLIKKQ